MIVFGIDLVYIFSGVALARRSVGDVIWHVLLAAAMVTLGTWLSSNKYKMKSQ